ncbi:hypothetical protein DPMN_194877 [Dreissena polymorpha]|uniref:Uncharacterized protein n=1 Tax=Dreissena polymorpha TaxID=45954 RepID=A0A9D3XZB0_DREPO|nr:hypothetical protein DPMN_194877 [Dreissena polymorpha]
MATNPKQEHRITGATLGYGESGFRTFHPQDVSSPRRFSPKTFPPQTFLLHFGLSADVSPPINGSSL